MGALENPRRTRQGGNQRRARIFRWEEITPDNRGKIAVDSEIIPFHDIADDPGDDGPPHARPTYVNRHSPDPSGFEPKVAPLRGVGNGKFRRAPVKGGRSGRLTVPKR